MIELPYEFGKKVRSSIDQYRREHNIPEPEEVQKLGDFRRNETFLESELQYATSIDLTDNEIDLNLFPNLTSIKIKGNIFKDKEYIETIISRYPNLEELYIYDSQINSLNLGNLKRLKKLSLISNHNLWHIYGIENLEQLESLNFYDNTSFKKQSKEFLEKVNTLLYNGKECTIDTMYLHDFKKIGIKNPQNIKWVDYLNDTRINTKSIIDYSNYEILEGYNIAKEIVNNYIKDTDTEHEKYAILYQWMCENVKYDDYGKDHMHTHHENNKMVGKIKGTNGSINAFLYKSCVCQGYTKAMQLLLTMVGIHSDDISCLAENLQKIDKNKNILPDHSIIRVVLDGKNYYSDITWDAGRYQKRKERKYFLLSEEEMGKDHYFTGEKDKITLDNLSKEEFDKLMTFAQERIKNVDKIKKDIPVKQTLEEKIIKIDEKLEILNEQKIIYSLEIEKLETEYSYNKKQNSRDKLKELYIKLKGIEKQINIQINRKKMFEKEIKSNIEQNHRKIIRTIEELIGVEITNIEKEEWVKQNEHMIMKISLKNNELLIQEYKKIEEKLRQAYIKQEIDLKTYNLMLNEINTEYEKYNEENKKTLIKSKIESLIDQMEKGNIDVNGKAINQNNQKITNSRTMGFTGTGLLGIISLISAMLITIIGLLILK